MMIDSQRVEEIFKDCLFKEGENTEKHIKAEGITSTVGFHPERLENHKQEIITMLGELPDAFHEGKGGGWSFLNACQDKNGRQWTDLHQRMEQLFQLGIGLGKAKFQMPREMWKVLPGGMPYICINL